MIDHYEENPGTDLLTISLGIMTFFYGALLGIFSVGLLTRSRGTTLSNLSGVVASIAAVFLKTYTELAWPWFIVSGSLITFAIAFAGRTTSVVLERFRVAAAEADAAA